MFSSCWEGEDAKKGDVNIPVLQLLYRSQKRILAMVSARPREAVQKIVTETEPRLKCRSHLVPTTESTPT
jgi:hypothetical protein